MGLITLRWIEDKMSVVTDSNGHSIVVGRSPDPEFEWSGVKPSDLLLMAVAACSAYDVVEILTKQREPLTDLRILCEGDQMSDPPYSFTNIRLNYIVKGNIKPGRLEKAIQLSEEKYCSVISTLVSGVSVTSDFEFKE